MAAAIKLAEPAAPVTALEMLILERASLADALAKLQASAARLADTSASEAAVIQEIGAMGSAEIAAMSKWASDGCAGEMPTPDLKLRRVLAEKLASAQAAATAAKGAAADIDRQIAEFSAQLASIGQSIEQAALDDLQNDFASLFDQHVEAVEKARALAARLHGLCSYLSSEGRRRTDNGEPETGREYLARAEALTAVRLANPGVTTSEIIAAANAWAVRAAALSRGSAV